MKDYSSSAPEGPQSRCRAERAGREPLPTRCPPRGALRDAAAAAGVSRPAGATGRAEGTRAAVPPTGPRKAAAPERARSRSLLASSRRPCSSTRARVLLTNGPGARRWSCRRRRLLSVGPQVPSGRDRSCRRRRHHHHRPFWHCRRHPDPARCFFSLLLPSGSCSACQPLGSPRGGREAGREPRGTSKGLAKPGLGH